MREFGEAFIEWIREPQNSIAVVLFEHVTCPGKLGPPGIIASNLQYTFTALRSSSSDHRLRWGLSLQGVSATRL